MGDDQRRTRTRRDHRERLARALDLLEPGPLRGTRNLPARPRTPRTARAWPPRCPRTAGPPSSRDRTRSDRRGRSAPPRSRRRRSPRSGARATVASTTSRRSPCRGWRPAPRPARDRRATAAGRGDPGFGRARYQRSRHDARSSGTTTFAIVDQTRSFACKSCAIRRPRTKSRVRFAFSLPGCSTQSARCSAAPPPPSCSHGWQGPHLSEAAPTASPPGTRRRWSARSTTIGYCELLGRGCPALYRESEPLF